MNDSLFCSIGSAAIASHIHKAKHSVCYAAPGIQLEPAKAMAELAQRIGPELITVCLDFDERVMRLGFGDLRAVEILNNAGIVISSIFGLRTGLFIFDHEGYIYTPTALFLEAEDLQMEAPNAMRLSREQVTETLARLSPSAKAIALALAKSEEEREQIRARSVEVPSTPVSIEMLDKIRISLEEAPPTNFDIARQVRVFNSYLQYVDLKFKGAAIQRRRFSISKALQKLGISKELEGRIRTTFDLIKEGDNLSSKSLESLLNKIRKNFTRSIGNHGRVLLKSAKVDFEKRINAFREELKVHQDKISNNLQNHLNESRNQIVNYFIPIVLANPPDEMLGQYLNFEEAQAREWINRELDKDFPRAEMLIKKIQLEVQYKDVTFETLNHKDFLKDVKKAFPGVDWDNPYNEFRAIGEKKVH